MRPGRIVSNLPASIAWYKAIGFTLIGSNAEDSVVDWAHLAFGEGRVMLNSGGEPSTAERRDADLYLQADDVAGRAQRLRGTVDMIENIHDTLYGMREFIVRDPDHRCITFGEPVELSA